MLFMTLQEEGVEGWGKGGGDVGGGGWRGGGGGKGEMGGGGEIEVCRRGWGDRGL